MMVADIPKWAAGLRLNPGAQIEYLQNGGIRITGNDVAGGGGVCGILTAGGGAYGRGVVTASLKDDRPPGIYWTRTSGKTHRVEIKR
jgi:hypothetical protein